MAITKSVINWSKSIFRDRDNVLSIIVLTIASYTYLSTIEPTTSFWDCGEFITSSYKLEVGHPPGNPVFQLIARFFTLFGSKENAALLINAMSALCSAFTIFFLYLTIVLLGRRVYDNTDDTNGVLVSGAALLGSLTYCFSDTFWFSAVEGEVYAMSSLFTAVVFWCVFKWESEADSPYANRWIILIAFLMGISIGVHLLNLLTIPALVFIYYYKKYDITLLGGVKVLLLSGVILAAILYGIIPYLPIAAAYLDLLFVNVFGLSANSGAVFFISLLIIICFAVVYYTYKRRKLLLNTILLSFLMVVIGYSVFAVIIIRSCANTPTNEYQPDNPFTLVRYLEREQYGSKPLIYGETFASQVKDVTIPTYYNLHNGRYVKLDAPAVYKYEEKSKMLFPRMWSGYSDGHVAFYKMYTNGKRAPSFADNLRFFWDYQIDFMYLRYFMWNFVGRQNDLHSTLPGDKLKGNWESGVGFIDKLRLGDNDEGPNYVSNSKSKNHYYFLPLVLGLLGLFWQFKRDRKGWFVVMLLFFLAGLAIVVYLNQSPLQVRERDYAYAGSFYAFCMWVGFAVFRVAEFVEKLSGKLVEKLSVRCFIIILLCSVPALMAVENWDDHDRSGRYTTREMAWNILKPLDSNAVLITHTDNDTFPLWYLQEVEEIRTDVRIVNTSLLGTDWYIDQMQRKINDCLPIFLSIGREQYFYGTNDGVIINERISTPVDAKEVIEVFKNKNLTVQSPFKRGEECNYIAARNLIIPVNRENVIKNKIVPECDYDKIVNEIILTIPESKTYLSKDELIILDMLSNYDWDRPLYFLGAGGVNIGVKEWLQFEGFVYRFVPIKSDTGVYEMSCTQTDVERVYNSIKNVYDFSSLNDSTINMDYQNLITFSAVFSPRQIFVTAAQACFDKWQLSLEREGMSVESDELKRRGVELLDMMLDSISPVNIPVSTLVLDSRNDITICRAINLYLLFGEKNKAFDMGDIYYDELLKHLNLVGFEEQTMKYIYTLGEIFISNGEKKKGESYFSFVF